MRTDHIAAIRTACIKANPEIVELRPMCRIQSFFKGHGIILQREPRGPETDTYIIAYDYLPEPIVERTPFNNNWTIIGRPIRLADVLLAIEQMLFDAEVITKAPYHQTFAEVCELYEFRTDDLEQQSDETIAFIHSLLREI